ncbi:uncharacterized protein HMPREF1541_04449 [Cyphellophora europaea CBS 101466]|uniref:Involucrin repeat protein n=1 Tax=Cyphellophora europaea (strain CBS 101466) TaxID=1220924 RepID=W2RWL5_CYPE1|nr:uncharacterized protein HMPREF1541_04449 [Cyphellophora europaea CBS 101466]ETN40173.1 hypothetical protein HMPREF1541_04449 [Cyphellophora europaea CBS 101466]
MPSSTSFASSSRSPYAGVAAPSVASSYATANDSYGSTRPAELVRNESMADSPKNESRRDSKRGSKSEKKGERRRTTDDYNDDPRNVDRSERGSRDSKKSSKSEKKDKSRAYDSHDASLLQNQFPGQDPSGYAEPYRPPGQASVYYNDNGESVGYQPGVRPDAPSIVYSADQAHLMRPTTNSQPPPEPSSVGRIGASASYFDGEGGAYDTMEPKRPAKPGKKPKSGEPSNRVSGSRPRLGNSDRVPSSGPMVTGALGGNAVGEAAAYFSGAPMTSGHDPRPYQTASPESFVENTRPPKQSASSHGQSYSYGGAAAAGVAASAAGAYMASQSHHSNAAYHQSGPDPSFVVGQNQSAFPQMQYQHRHERRGPLGKFVNWFKDPDSVAQFEQYTEAIGVCKYCFDPNSSPMDAPRKHHYHGRRSSQKRRYEGSSRVDKNSRYSSSDDERRRSSTSKKIIAGGLAGLGAAKIGQTLYDQKHDFDDTYSVRTGQINTERPANRSRVSFQEDDWKQSASRGVNFSKEEFRDERRGSERKSKSKRVDESSEKRRTRRRRSSSSSSSSNGISKTAALGLGAAGLAAGAAVASQHRSRSRSPSKRKKGYYSKRISPKHSYVDLNDTKTGTFGLGQFFSPSQNEKKGKHSKGFFHFSNSSGSSSDADLAFGEGTVRRKNSRKFRRSDGQDDFDAATAAALTATGMALASESDGKGRRKRNANVHRDDRARRVDGAPRIKLQDHETTTDADNDDGWYDTDGEGAPSSDDGGLQYGGRASAAQSKESLVEEGGWWPWSTPTKRRKERPSSSSHPYTPTRINPGAAAALGAGVGAVAAGMMSSQQPSSGRSTGSLPPMQEIEPIPASDSMMSGAIGPSKTASGQYVSTTGSVPLQQPQPIVPIGSFPEAITNDIANDRRISERDYNSRRRRRDSSPAKLPSRGSQVTFDVPYDRFTETREDERERERRDKKERRKTYDFSEIAKDDEKRAAREAEIEAELQRLYEEDRKRRPDRKRAKEESRGSYDGIGTAAAAAIAGAGIVAASGLSQKSRESSNERERPSGTRKSSLKKSKDRADSPATESQQERIARMAAQRVQSESPVVEHDSYGTFFVPKEIAEHVEEHNIASSTRDDPGEAQVVEIVPGEKKNELFDPFNYRVFGTRDDDDPLAFPWAVPTLALVEATPPASRLGSRATSPAVSSAASPVSSPVEGREPVMEEDLGEKLDRKGAKVTWGDHDTYVYEVMTPEEERTNFIPEQRKEDRPSATVRNAVAAAAAAAAAAAGSRNRGNRDFRPSNLSRVETLPDEYGEPEKPSTREVPPVEQMSAEQREHLSKGKGFADMPGSFDAPQHDTPVVEVSLDDLLDRRAGYEAPLSETMSDLVDITKVPKTGHGFVEDTELPETPRDEHPSRDARDVPQVSPEIVDVAPRLSKSERRRMERAASLEGTSQYAPGTTSEPRDQDSEVFDYLVDDEGRPLPPSSALNHGVESVPSQGGRTERERVRPTNDDTEGYAKPKRASTFDDDFASDKRRSKSKSDYVSDPEDWERSPSRNRDQRSAKSDIGSGTKAAVAAGAAAASMAAIAAAAGEDDFYAKDKKSKRRSKRDSEIFNDDDVGSVVSSPATKADDKKARRRSKRESEVCDDDDTRSVASSPADSSSRKSKDRKDKDKDKEEKRSTGMWGSIFGGPKSDISTSSKKSSKSSKSEGRAERSEQSDKKKRRSKSFDIDDNASAASEPMRDSRGNRDSTPTGAVRDPTSQMPSRDQSVDDGFVSANEGSTETPVNEYSENQSFLAERLDMPHKRPTDTPMATTDDGVSGQTVTTERQTPSSGETEITPITQARRVSLLRTADLGATPSANSPTAVPINFRRPPGSPATPRAFFSSPVASPQSPSTTPRTRQGRPKSTEFRSKEFRPLYLVEKSRSEKTPLPEAEDNLPSLPSSRSSSAHPSMDNLRAAAEKQDYFGLADGKVSPRSFQERGRRHSYSLWNVASKRPESPDYLDSRAATPVPSGVQRDRELRQREEREAREKTRVDQGKPKYEFHSPSELLQDPASLAEFTSGDVEEEIRVGSPLPSVVSAQDDDFMSAREGTPSERSRSRSRSRPRSRRDTVTAGGIGLGIGAAAAFGVNELLSRKDNDEHRSRGHDNIDQEDMYDKGVPPPGPSLPATLTEQGSGEAVMASTQEQSREVQPDVSAEADEWAFRTAGKKSKKDKKKAKAKPAMADAATFEAPPTVPSAAEEPLTAEEVSTPATSTPIATDEADEWGLTSSKKSKKSKKGKKRDAPSAIDVTKAEAKDENEQREKDDDEPLTADDTTPEFLPQPFDDHPVEVATPADEPTGLEEHNDKDAFPFEAGEIASADRELPSQDSPLSTIERTTSYVPAADELNKQTNDISAFEEAFERAVRARGLSQSSSREAALDAFLPTRDNPPFVPADSLPAVGEESGSGTPSSTEKAGTDVAVEPADLPTMEVALEDDFAWAYTSKKDKKKKAQAAASVEEPFAESSRGEDLTGAPEEVDVGKPLEPGADPLEGGEDEFSWVPSSKKDKKKKRKSGTSTPVDVASLVEEPSSKVSETEVDAAPAVEPAEPEPPTPAAEDEFSWAPISKKDKKKKKRQSQASDFSEPTTPAEDAPTGAARDLPVVSAEDSKETAPDTWEEPTAKKGKKGKKNKHQSSGWTDDVAPIAGAAAVASGATLVASAFDDDKKEVVAEPEILPKSETDHNQNVLADEQRDTEPVEPSTRESSTAEEAETLADDFFEMRSSGKKQKDKKKRKSLISAWEDEPVVTEPEAPATEMERSVPVDTPSEPVEAATQQSGSPKIPPSSTEASVEAQQSIEPEAPKDLGEDDSAVPAKMSKKEKRKSKKSESMALNDESTSQSVSQKRDMTAPTPVEPVDEQEAVEQAEALRKASPQEHHDDPTHQDFLAGAHDKSTDFPAAPPEQTQPRDFPGPDTLPSVVAAYEPSQTVAPSTPLENENEVPAEDNILFVPAKKSKKEKRKEAKRGAIVSEDADAPSASTMDEPVSDEVVEPVEPKESKPVDEREISAEDDAEPVGASEHTPAEQKVTDEAEAGLKPDSTTEDFARTAIDEPEDFPWAPTKKSKKDKKKGKRASLALDDQPAPSPAVESAELTSTNTIASGAAAAALGTAAVASALDSASVTPAETPVQEAEDLSWAPTRKSKKDKKKRKSVTWAEDESSTPQTQDSDAPVAPESIPASAMNEPQPPSSIFAEELITEEPGHLDPNQGDINAQALAEGQEEIEKVGDLAAAEPAPLPPDDVKAAEGQMLETLKQDPEQPDPAEAEEPAGWFSWATGKKGKKDKKKRGSLFGFVAPAAEDAPQSEAVDDSNVAESEAVKMEDVDTLKAEVVDEGIVEPEVAESRSVVPDVFETETTEHQVLDLLQNEVVETGVDATEVEAVQPKSDSEVQLTTEDVIEDDLLVDAESKIDPSAPFKDADEARIHAEPGAEEISRETVPEPDFPAPADNTEAAMEDEWATLSKKSKKDKKKKRASTLDFDEPEVSEPARLAEGSEFHEAAVATGIETVDDFDWDLGLSKKERKAKEKELKLAGNWPPMKAKEVEPVPDIAAEPSIEPKDEITTEPAVEAAVQPPKETHEVLTKELGPSSSEATAPEMIEDLEWDLGLSSKERKKKRKQLELAGEWPPMKIKEPESDIVQEVGGATPAAEATSEPSAQAEMVEDLDWDLGLSKKERKAKEKQLKSVGNWPPMKLNETVPDQSTSPIDVVQPDSTQLDFDDMTKAVPASTDVLPTASLVPESDTPRELPLESEPVEEPTAEDEWGFSSKKSKKEKKKAKRMSTFSAFDEASGMSTPDPAPEVPLDAEAGKPREDTLAETSATETAIKTPVVSDLVVAEEGTPAPTHGDIAKHEDTEVPADVPREAPDDLPVAMSVGTIVAEDEWAIPSTSKKSKKDKKKRSSTFDWNEPTEPVDTEPETMTQDTTVEPDPIAVLPDNESGAKDELSVAGQEIVPETESLARELATENLESSQADTPVPEDESSLPASSKKGKKDKKKKKRGSTLILDDLAEHVVDEIAPVAEDSAELAAESFSEAAQADTNEHATPIAAEVPSDIEGESSRQVQTELEHEPLQPALAEGVAVYEPAAQMVEDTDWDLRLNSKQRKKKEKELRNSGNWPPMKAAEREKQAEAIEPVFEPIQEQASVSDPYTEPTSEPTPEETTRSLSEPLSEQRVELSTPAETAVLPNQVTEPVSATIAEHATETVEVEDPDWDFGLSSKQRKKKEKELRSSGKWPPTMTIERAVTAEPASEPVAEAEPAVEPVPESLPDSAVAAEPSAVAAEPEADDWGFSSKKSKKDKKKKRGSAFSWDDEQSTSVDASGEVTPTPDVETTTVGAATLAAGAAAAVASATKDDEASRDIEYPAEPDPVEAGSDDWAIPTKKNTKNDKKKRKSIPGSFATDSGIATPSTPMESEPIIAVPPPPSDESKEVKSSFGREKSIDDALDDVLLMDTLQRDEAVDGKDRWAFEDDFMSGEPSKFSAEPEDLDTHMEDSPALLETRQPEDLPVEPVTVTESVPKPEEFGSSKEAAPDDDWAFMTSKPSKKEKKKKRQSTLQEPSADISADVSAVATPERAATPPLAEQEWAQEASGSAETQALVPESEQALIDDMAQDTQEAVPEDDFFTTKKSKKDKKKKRQSTFDDVQPESSKEPEPVPAVDPVIDATPEPTGEATIGSARQMDSETSKNTGLGAAAPGAAAGVGAAALSGSNQAQPEDAAKDDDAWGFTPSRKSSKKDKKKKNRQAEFYEPIEEPSRDLGIEEDAAAPVAVPQEEISDVQAQAPPIVDQPAEAAKPEDEWDLGPSRKLSKKDKKKNRRAELYEPVEEISPDSLQTDETRARDSKSQPEPVADEVQPIDDFEPEGTRDVEQPSLSEKDRKKNSHAEIYQPQTEEAEHVEVDEPAVADTETVAQSSAAPIIEPAGPSDPALQADPDDVWGFKPQRKASKKERKKQKESDFDSSSFERHLAPAEDSASFQAPTPPPAFVEAGPAAGASPPSPRIEEADILRDYEEPSPGLARTDTLQEVDDWYASTTKPKKGKKKGGMHRADTIDDIAMSYGDPVAGQEEGSRGSKKPDTIHEEDEGFVVSRKKSKKDKKKGKVPISWEEETLDGARNAPITEPDNARATSPAQAWSATAAPTEPRDTTMHDSDGSGVSESTRERRRRRRSPQAWTGEEPPDLPRDRATTPPPEHNEVMDTALGVAAHLGFGADEKANVKQAQHSSAGTKEEPGWSFATVRPSRDELQEMNRDSGVQFESPVVGSGHDSVRDSGYVPAWEQGSQRDSLRPMRPQSPTSSTEDVTREMAPEGSFETPARRQPSPIESTSKDRSSVVFKSSPAVAPPGTPHIDTSLAYMQTPSDLRRSPSIHGRHKSREELRQATEDRRRSTGSPLASNLIDRASSSGVDRSVFSPPPSSHPLSPPRSPLRAIPEHDQSDSLTKGAIVAGVGALGAAALARDSTRSLAKSKSRSGSNRSLRGSINSPFDNTQAGPSRSFDESSSGKAAAPERDMADYDGYGHHPGSPMSPTRPPSITKRRSMQQISDLQAKIDQLAGENRNLAEAKIIAERHLEDFSINQNKAEYATQEALRTAEAQLRDRDEEIAKLQHEIAGMAALHEERASWQESTRELETLRSQHHELSNGMDSIIRHEIDAAMIEKNAELERLQRDLAVAKDKIRELQSQILAQGASGGDDYIIDVKDEDYFDGACQQLCQHVQQWVLRFSKYSDARMCRTTNEVRDEKIVDRFDNAILDGSDVDIYLGDRVKRRDVFMSVVMTMIWEYVFTRYLFGMDREQRQKLKQLEKNLAEVGPASAVNRWRAITLTMLSKRAQFKSQCENDTEAVALEVFATLSKFLPPPGNAEGQIVESLRGVMRKAVSLSVEMRCQRQEYVMLPPLQPEYDTNGDLARQVYFNASLMNERSGETRDNEELEREGAVVRVVLFPLVVCKTLVTEGEGTVAHEREEEVVVCPAQVLVAREGRRSKSRQSGVSGGRSASGTQRVASMDARSTHSLGAMSGVEPSGNGGMI